MRKPRFYLLFILLLISTLLAGNSNVTITFQGRLIDSIGSPVNGTRVMRFKIFDQETNGTSIPANSEGFLLNGSGSINHKVICNDGNYATEIQLTAEEVVSLNAFENAYLEIYVGNTTTVEPLRDVMKPRIHLSATPYAIKAKQIEGLIINGRGSSDSATKTNDGKSYDMSIFY